MSIEKWLSDKDSKEEKIRREKAFKNLSEVEVKELKKKKIRAVVQKANQELNELNERDNFLHKIIEFKEWLIQRSYLKGDIEKIETWIKNLYFEIQHNSNQKENLIDRKSLIEEYKSIPPTFLDEKTRIAINKKIRGTKKTNSDNYYLRKLKRITQEKLIESKYYKILEKLLKL
ncbi:MAG: hypothetical protein ACFFEN_00215 [Candidatus Thorarchaeota archaeon]